MSREQMDLAVLVSELRVYQATQGNPNVSIDARTTFAFTDGSMVEAMPWNVQLQGDHELGEIWASQTTDGYHPPYYGVFNVGMDALGVKLGPDELKSIACAIGRPTLGRYIAESAAAAKQEKA